MGIVNNGALRYNGTSMPARREREAPMERLFALWNQAMQKPWIAKCWQFIKFGIVGVSNTLISLAVYQLALNALGLHYLAANALGLVISVVNAYYWNNRCVFGGGQKRPFLKHVALYFKSLTAYGGTFVLDSLLLVFWVEAIGIPEALAPVLNLCITIPLNFFINKYWTFRR